MEVSRCLGVGDVSNECHCGAKGGVNYNFAGCWTQEGSVIGRGMRDRNGTWRIKHILSKTTVNSCGYPTGRPLRETLQETGRSGGRRYHENVHPACRRKLFTVVLNVFRFF